MEGPKGFENKLYSVRSLEGKPNTKALDEVRIIERRFTQDPSFVAIAPFGSTVKGYSTESSDLDVMILFDGEIAVRKSPYEILREAEEDSMMRGWYIHGNFCDLQTIRTHVFQFPVIPLANLSRAVMGRKVEQYREAARGRLSALNKERRNIVLKDALSSLIREEELGIAKLVKRNHTLRGLQATLLESRKKLWRRRLEKLWGTFE